MFNGGRIQRVYPACALCSLEETLFCFLPASEAQLVVTRREGLLSRGPSTLELSSLCCPTADSVPDYFQVHW